MNIDEMPAGREMNVLVAERIMGWTETVSIFDGKWQGGIPPEGTALHETVMRLGKKARISCYSTDIATAWQVVERVVTETVWECYLTHQFDGWNCLFSAPDKLDAHGVGESAPLAVCRAALKLMEGK